MQGQNFRYSSENSPPVAKIFLERKFEKKKRGRGGGGGGGDPSASSHLFTSPFELL